MMPPRFLIVTADDFGIGPATSEGILDLARQGVVTAAALQVNSPFAAAAVQVWRRGGRRPELGWHPCLTLDGPVLPPDMVPTLVRPDGRFWNLRSFLTRLALGRIRRVELAAELLAQHGLFQELTGQQPRFVNAHHHLHLVPAVAGVLREVLAGQPAPYCRRVWEPWSMISRVSGARLRRLILTLVGRGRVPFGLPGNDVLAGLTDDRHAADREHLFRWLLQVPGRVVELVCHPGYRDDTLPGRDGGLEQMRRRVFEMQRLQDLRFREACDEAGFILVAPGQLDQELARAA